MGQIFYQKIQSQQSQQIKTKLNEIKVKKKKLKTHCIYCINLFIA